MNLKYFILGLIFLLLISYVTSSVTLRQGEVYEVQSKELVVENVGSDKIKVNVDGVKNIINVGEQKEVNGVDILVVIVFYDDIPGERTVEVVMSIAFYCGDGNCDTGQNESKENCCEDCGCNPGYVCSDSVCKTESQVEKEKAEEEAKKIGECEKDIDCDDNDPNTEDTCISKPGKPNKCLHLSPICQTDIDCDDQDPCTVDRCVDNDCFNTKVPDFVECWQKREAQEEIEKEETISEELPEKVIEEVEEKTEEKGFFSKIISLFLSLFR